MHDSIEVPSPRVSRLALLTVVAAGLVAALPVHGAISRGCIQDDRLMAGQTAFSGNFCTANDLTFVLIGLGIQDDGCFSTTDTSNILQLRAILENTGAGTRYDAGLWISPHGDIARCKLSGGFCTTDADCGGGQDTCAGTARWGSCLREIAREPAWVQGTRSCTVSSGGVNLTCGAGTFINEDGDGCGDILKFGTNGPPNCGQTVDMRIDPTNAACNTPDTVQDQTVFDFDEPIVLPCVDRDQDGFMEIPTCSSWGQNATDISCSSKTCLGGTRPGLQCVSDPDCGVGGLCLSPSCSTCQGSGASCTSAAGCPAGQLCGGTCSGSGSFCSDTIPCPTGQTCDTRTCQGSGDPCTTAANCPSGQVCGASTDPRCRIERAIPGTSSKCNCQDNLNSNVPVAEMGLSCSCQPPTEVRPGFPVTCTITYTNTQPANCIPDPLDPERFQCGTFAYARFDVDDALSGAQSGSFTGVCSAQTGFCSVTTSQVCQTSDDCPGGETCLVPSCTTDSDCPSGQTCSYTTARGSVGGSPADIQWLPGSAATNTLGIVGPGDTDSLTFLYTPSSSAPDGPIDLTTSTLFVNKTCSTSGAVCEQDSQCPMGETCQLDFSTPPATVQSLSTICSLDVNATYASVSDLRAFEDAGRVVVEWETAAEVGAAGFNLLRRNPATGEYERLNDELLPAADHLPGGSYRFVDETLSAWEGATYEVQEVDLHGRVRTHGPFTVDVKWDRSEREREAIEGTFSALPRKPSPAMRERVAASREANRLELRKKPAAPETGSGGVERAKLAVRADGLYRVSAQQIAAALGEKKADQLIRSGRLALSVQGREVAWQAAGDGSAILFYGQGLDSPFTLDNVYWLEQGGGLEMETASGAAPAPVTGASTFVDTVAFEEDLLPRPAVSDDPRGDHWFWKGFISGHPSLGTQSFTFDLSGVSGTGDASVHVGLWGISGGAAGSGHRVEVSVNGALLGEDAWSENGLHGASFDLSGATLHEGSNTLTVRDLQGLFFVDSFDVSYARLYRASGDRLELRGDANPVVSVSGFSGPAVSVYELGDPLRPRRLVNVTLDQAPDGTYRASFVPASGATPYLAVADSAAAPVASVLTDRPSNLRDPANRASYVVISSGEILPAAERLAEYRAADGLETLVVDVEDVMDEFNDGIFDPEAIRSFLSYARSSWALGPRYVALAGKASQDYRDLLGLGGNPVPMILAPTENGLFPADNRYGDSDGDGVPEIAVGRIPVLTAAELDAYVAKIAAYESAPDGAWSRRILLAADNPDQAGNFPADSDGLAATVPEGFQVDTVYLSQPYTTAGARQALLDAIAQGRGLINWVGHGGFDRLAQEGVLQTADVAGLTNGERLPVVTALTCNIAFFGFPGFTSLGEELVLHPAGGAAAVWAPSGLSVNNEAVRLGRSAFEGLLGAGSGRIGDAIVYSLERFAASGGKREMIGIYNLLGDPGLVKK